MNSSQTREQNERLFVNAFVNKEKRERWVDGLSKLKRRNLFLSRLADSRDFDVNFLYKLKSHASDPEAIFQEISNLGRCEKCWVISQYGKIDMRQLEAWDALRLAIGIGLGTILMFQAESFCYYEGEMPQDRWVLSRQV